MPIRDRLLASCFDQQITTATQIKVLAQLALEADETGSIPATNPDAIAQVIGVRPRAVYAAFGELERIGYITWRRSKGAAAKAGVPGAVRIILPAA